MGIALFVAHHPRIIQPAVGIRGGGRQIFAFGQYGIPGTDNLATCDTLRRVQQTFSQEGRVVLGCPLRGPVQFKALLVQGIAHQGDEIAINSM